MARTSLTACWLVVARCFRRRPPRRFFATSRRGRRPMRRARHPRQPPYHPGRADQPLLQPLPAPMSCRRRAVREAAASNHSRYRRRLVWRRPRHPAKHRRPRPCRAPCPACRPVRSNRAARRCSRPIPRQPGDEIVVEPPPQRITKPTAAFSGLDKITGRIISFDVAINETVQFGALQVTPRACHPRPPTETPRSTLSWKSTR